MPGTGVAMDWDDEDEATTVFGRDDVAPSFLRGPGPAAGTPALPALNTQTTSRGPALPAMVRPSGAPSVGSLFGDPKPVAPPRPPAAPVAAAPAPVFSPIQQVPQSSSKTLVLFAAVVVVVFAAVVTMVVILGNKPGSLMVTVGGPNDRKLDQFQVYVDDQLRCEAPPCSVGDLKKGNHRVSAKAPGYEPLADRLIAIEAGKESVANLTLTHASAGTGVSVSADNPAGLTLYVDGQKVGELSAQPLAVNDLTPGDHKIRVEGKKEENENYELAPFEQVVTVVAEKLSKVDAKLKVLAGQVKIEEGENASKATVLLVSGSERRRVPVLPANLKKIDATKGYAIIATRDGYEDYREEIKFEDGQPVRTYTVTLQRKGAEPSSGTSSASYSARPSPAVAANPGPKPPAAATGGSRLNLNSIPVSSVILDGRPLGPTPKIGISVSAGTHTVVFVHAQFGRKVQTVTVEAGETKTAAVRFQ